MNETINVRLFKFLDFKGITGYKLAKALGTSEAVISNIRNEKNKPNIDIIEKMLHIYEVSPEWLLTGRGSMLRDGTTAREEQAVSPPAAVAATPTCPICQGKDLVITTLQASLKDKDNIIEAKNTIIQSRDKEIHRLESELAIQKKESSILGTSPQSCITSTKPGE